MSQISLSSSLNLKKNLNLNNSNTSIVALNTQILYILIWELVGLFLIALCFQLICLSLNLASVAIILSQLNTIFWIVEYTYDHARAQLVHKLEDLLENKPNSYSKKIYVKSCCVVRNRTSLKNTATMSTYSLQSKPF